MISEPLTPKAQKRRLFQWIILVIALIALGAYLYFSYESNAMHTATNNKLKTIADLKISQITEWNRERIADAKNFSQSPFFTEGLSEWLKNPEDKQGGEELKKRIKLIDNDGIYSDVIISEPESKILLSLDPEMTYMDSSTAGFIKKAAQAKELLTSDLYYCPLHNKIHLDYIAPVIDGADKVLAVLILRIDPEKYLYPLIKTWPVPSKTSETLIVRKEGNRVLYLNELNHQKNTALKFSLPLSDTLVPAVRAVTGYKGIFDGLSYRGSKVLAYIQPVKGTDWIMIAQQDESEILEGLHFREAVIISFTILLITLLVLGLIIYYNLRQKNIYRELFIKEKELREYHEEFRTILYSIGDGVITTDVNGKIKQMNKTSEELTGWKESDAIGKSIDLVFKIFNELTREQVPNPVYKVLREGVIVGLANHTILVSKDARETPIADSGAPIRDAEGKIEGVVLVFRDKSEEHRAEKLIHQSEARLTKAEINSKSGNWELHLNSGKTIASKGAQIIYGLSDSEWSIENIKKIPRPEDRPMLDEALKNLIESGQPYNVEFKIRSADTGEIKDIHSIAEYDAKNRIVFGIIQDVTERKAVQEMLTESNNKYMSLFGAMNEGVALHEVIYDKNNKAVDYRIIDLNPAFEKHTGIPQKSAINSLASELYGISPAPFLDTYAGVADSGIPAHLETYFPPMEKYFDISIFSPGKSLFATVFTDITETKLSSEKIAQSEKRFRSIVENTDAGYFFIDKNGIIRDVNDAWCRLYKFESKDEIIGQHFTIIQRLDDLESAGSFFDGILNGDPLFMKGDFSRKCKDGSTGYHSFSARPVFQMNEPIGIEGFIIDITELKLAEESVKSSENFLNNLVETIPFPVFYKNLAGEYINANQAFISLFGYSKEQLTGKTVYDLYTRELADLYFRKDTELLAEGGIQVYESKFMDVNGNEHDVLLHKAVYKDNNGKAAGLIGAMVDLTERKAAETALRVSEEKFRTTLYSIGDGVIATDENGRIKHINKIAENLTGWTESETLNHPLEEVFRIINEETRTTVENPVKKVLREGEIVGLANHTLLIAKDGTEIPIADSGAPIRNENGEMTGVVLVFRDQMKERAAQKILEESEAQLKYSQKVARLGYYIYDIIADNWTSPEMLSELFGIDENFERNASGWLEVVHPDFREEMQSYLINHVLTEGKEFNKEYKIKRISDGKEFWVHGLGSLEYGKDGKPVKMFGTIQDITDRRKAADELKSQKELAETIVNNIPIMIAFFNNRGEFEFVNDEWIKLLGWSLKEIKESRDFIADMYPDEKARDEALQFMMKGEPHWQDFKTRTMKGNFIDTSWTNVKLSDGRSIGIGHDITERKKTQDAIEKNKERWESLFNNSPAAIAIYKATDNGKDFIFTDFNETAQRIDQVKREEVIGKKISEIFPSTEDLGFLEVFRKVWETGRTEYINFHYKDERMEGWRENVIFKLNTGEVVAIYSDVTPRMRAEIALRESEEKFKSLFENAADPILLVDFDQTIINVNPAATKILGYSREELLNMKTQDLNTEEYRPEINSRFEILKNKGELFFETAHFAKDGRRLYFEIHSKVVEFEGEPRILSVYRDITEKKQADIELKKHREHLEELVRSRTNELNKLNDGLRDQLRKEKELEMMLRESLGKEKELNELKTRFISTASHEFRTPLTSVLSSAELIERYGNKWEWGKISSHIDRIKKSVEYVTNLLNEVLTISRVESGKITFVPEDIDLKSFCLDIINEVTSGAEIKRNIIFNFNPDKNTFHLDPKLLKFILTNLLSNAVKYTRPNGNIELNVHADSNQLSLEVKDDGIGIPDHDRSHLFEPFHRCTNSAEIPGTGLGLSIVKQSVDLHKGEIKVSSRLGSGSSFIVKLNL